MNKIVDNVGGFLKDIGRNVIENIENTTYGDGIEIGKSNTIKALLYADINDRDTFISIIKKLWDMDETEIEDRIVYEKECIIIEKIKQYLKFNGYTENNIRDFLEENAVNIKLNKNNNLWKLKNNPENLIKEIKGKK